MIDFIDDMNAVGYDWGGGRPKYKPQPYTQRQIEVLANLHRIRSEVRNFKKGSVTIYKVGKVDVSSQVRTLRRRKALKLHVAGHIFRAVVGDPPSNWKAGLSMTPHGLETLRCLVAAEAASVTVPKGLFDAMGR